MKRRRRRKPDRAYILTTGNPRQNYFAGWVGKIAWTDDALKARVFAGRADAVKARDFVQRKCGFRPRLRPL